MGQLKLTSRAVRGTCSTSIAPLIRKTPFRELCAPLMEISDAIDGSKSRRSGVWTPEEITVL